MLALSSLTHFYAVWDSSPWTGSTHVPVPMEVGRASEVTWNCSYRALWLAGHRCWEVGSSARAANALNCWAISQLGFCAEVFWVLDLVSKHGHNGTYGRPQQFDDRLGKKAIPGEQLRVTETTPPRCRMDGRARWQVLVYLQQMWGLFLFQGRGGREKEQRKGSM